jgi:hypothetical protein
LVREELAMWNISKVFRTFLRAFVFAFCPLMMLAQTANTGAIAGGVSDPRERR